MFEGLFQSFHLLLILVTALLVFETKFPEIGSGLGKAIPDFKKAFSQEESYSIAPPKISNDEQKPLE